ncbi:hypothetical protein [Pseudorhodoplanes sp.]|uniref:hypothetical protein n=1 Tax=Pseudorhodoplanes sp. TaxID=1934341 RepID=UPI002C0BA1D5|nr:hypothetical protein [Pseudorhodoplanes sp.]HWV55183.1 hypothetical protein [Pseudorhodoplanes sp.]
MFSRPVFAALIATILSSLASPVFAGGVFLDVPMTRIFVCQGTDAKMEIYAPQSLVLKRNIEKLGLGGTVTGLYALDLSEAQKGKVIEPVRLRSTRDNKAITVDQFTRKGLKPTTVPMAGGSLDFDPRFGTQAKCDPFRPS